MIRSARLSDYIVSTLNSYGVEHFFLLVGGNAMYMNDAVLKSGISYSVFHHEQAAVMAAEAYARVNQKIGCVVVTSGPGATNTLTGIAGSFLDSSPIIVIAGQPKSTELRSANTARGVRQIGTFEIDFCELAQSICLYSKTIHQADQGPTILREALSAISGPRPGPALIQIPIDIQGEEINWPDEPLMTNEQPHSQENLELDTYLDLFEEAILQAERPLLAIGHGVRVANVAKSLEEFVGLSKIPVVTTQLAKDFLPYNHNSFIGHFGIRGDRPGNTAVQSADLILFLGTSLHQQNIGYEQTLFAPNANKFVVELDKSVSGKKMSIEANYLDCDLKLFVEEFSKRSFHLQFRKAEWLNTLSDFKKKFSVRDEPHKTLDASINLYHFVDFLSEALSGDESIVTDAGLCFYVMGQAFRIKGNQRYIVSGGLGSMGYALPAGIGMSIDNHASTIVVTGDGSMQMNVQELATVMALGTDIKIFVINNGGYASLRNTQRSFFGEPFIGASKDSGLLMPNWKQICSAYDIAYLKIDSYDSFESKIKHALSMVGPLFIEVMCHVEQEVMPGVGNYRDANGILRSYPLHKMSPLRDDSSSQLGLVIN